MATIAEIVGLREIARELEIKPSDVGYWVKKGWLTPVQLPQRKGDKLLLDRDQVLAVFRQRLKLDPRHKAAGRRAPPREGPRKGPQVRGAQRAPRPPPASTPLSFRTAQPPASPGVTAGPGYASHSPHTSSPPSPLPARHCRTADLLEPYYKDCHAAGNSPDTLSTQRHILGQFAQAVPELPCTREQVIDYLNGMGVAKTSQLRRFGRVKTFLRWAWENHQLDMPPLRRILVGVKDPLPDPLTEEELLVVLRYPKSFQEQVMIELLAETGMRVGELCSLTQQGVHPDHVSVQGKTGGITYTITAPTYDSLRELGSDYVFYDRSGRPMTRSGVRQRVERLFLACGVHKKKMGPHTFRHTFGTLMLKRSHGDLVMVQKALNHSRPNMTLRYAQMMKEDVREKVSQLSLLHLMEESGNNAAPVAAS